MQGYHRVKLFKLEDGEIVLEPGWKPFAYTRKMQPWAEGNVYDEYVVCREWVRLEKKKTLENLLARQEAPHPASRRRRERHLVAV